MLCLVSRSAHTPAKSTFAISEEDSEQIERIRLRLGRAGYLLNRTEAIRLGLNALDAADDVILSELVEKLDRRRPGRPTTKRRATK